MARERTENGVPNMSVSGDRVSRDSTPELLPPPPAAALEVLELLALPVLLELGRTHTRAAGELLEPLEAAGRKHARAAAGVRRTRAALARCIPVNEPERPVPGYQLTDL